MAAPQFTPQEKRDAAFRAIGKITRKQTEGDKGQGVGRMRTLRPAEQTRLVRRDPTLRKAFRRLRVNSASAAGASMKIRGIVKNLRTRIRKEGGVEFKTRAGGKKYLLKETVKSRRGKVGVKGLSREAVKEVVVEAEEKREEQGKGEKEARIAHRRKLESADERRRQRMAEIRMTREGRVERSQKAVQGQGVHDIDDEESSIGNREKTVGTAGELQESSNASIASASRGTTSVTNPEQLETQTSVADIAPEAAETAPEEPAGDAFTSVENPSLDMPGMDTDEGSGAGETEA